MALLTTFATTPLTSLLYPPWYQKKLEAWKRGDISWDSEEPSDDNAVAQKDPLAQNRVGQLLVYLRLDSMPGLLGLVSLFGQDAQDPSAVTTEKDGVALPPKRHVRAHGLRLLQLGDRDSSVMTVSEVEQYTKNDPVVNTWLLVGRILRLAVSGEVATMLDTRFPEALLAKSSDISSDLLLLPWSGTGDLGDTQAHLSYDKPTPSYLSFTKSVLASSSQNVGIFFPHAQDSGAPGAPDRLKLQRAYSFNDIHHDIHPLPVNTKSRRIIVPFFGGKDDKLALTLALQFCERKDVSVKVLHIMADSSTSASEEREYLNSVSGSLSADVAARAEFIFAPGNDAGEELVTSAMGSLGQDSGNVSWDNLVLVGRQNPAGNLAHSGKAAVEVSDDLVGCIGHSAGRLVGSGIKVDILIVQARTSKS